MKQPTIAKTARIFEGAVLLGDVTIGEECGIWPNVVLRGDMGPISVGNRVNIQDGSVCHTNADGSGTGEALLIGPDVTVGHLCILHGCTIGEGSLIGMGSILMNDVKIGKHCLIGAGSLVTEGTIVPDGSLAFGRPAKVVRALTEEEQRHNMLHAKKYADLLGEYA